MICFFPLWAQAKNCEKSTSFKSLGEQEVKITAVKFHHKNNQPQEQEVCKKQISIHAYDVQGMEKQAYHCLKPNEAQVLHCDTKYLGEKAKLSILPAIWLRKNKENKSQMAYRFHAYIQSPKSPSKYLDIFSRYLSPHTKPQQAILEGSKTAGATSPDNEGFWVRVEFL